MKICVVYEFFYPFVGGIETHILEFAKYAISKGHEVHVVTLNYGFNAEETYQGVHVHRVGKVGNIEGPVVSGISVRKGSFFKRILSMPKMFMKTWEVVRKHNIDIINPNLFISGLITYLVGKMTRRTVVVSWQGTYGKEGWYQIMGSKLKGGIFFFLEKIMLRIKPWDKLIVFDDGTGAAELALEIGVKKSDMLESFHGVDETMFKPKPKPAYLLKELDIKNEKVILFASRLTKIKGVDLMINAAPYIVDKIKNVKFLIVGGGEMKESFVERTKELGIEGKFIFLDSQPHDKMPDLFALADVCCYTGTVGNRSLSCLESLSCGKADVVTDVGRVKDFAKDGFNCVLVKIDSKEIADGVIKILTDEKLKRRLEENSRKFILDNMTIEKSYKDILIFFEEVKKSKA
jgi:glycosyltransferase involved in cell wall biosynthesis